MSRYIIADLTPLTRAEFQECLDRVADKWEKRKEFFKLVYGNEEGYTDAVERMDP